MKPAAPDFLLMWDNAYCIHEFDGEFVPFKDILSECEKYGNADMVFEFASTSKVTLPGAGIAVLCVQRSQHGVHDQAHRHSGHQLRQDEPAAPRAVPARTRSTRSR